MLPLFQWLVRGSAGVANARPAACQRAFVECLLLWRDWRRLNELVNRAYHALVMADKRLEKFGLLRHVALQFELGLMRFKIARLEDPAFEIYRAGLIRFRHDLQPSSSP